MSATQKRAYVLADNKLALNAGWDDQLLAEELQSLLLADEGFEIDLTGFSIAEVDLLIESSLPAEDGDPRDDELTYDAPSRCTFGDFWQLGPHRLACGDALDPLVVGEIEIALSPQALADRLFVEASRIDERVLAFTAPFQLRRRGIEAKIVSGATHTEPDQKLITLLAKAHRWLDEIKSGRPMHQISAEEGRGEDYVRARIELAFLSPKIQQQILDGTSPPELTLDRLVKGNIPVDWSEQESLFL